MGTRSLTILNDEDGKEIAVIYRQFDGYPNGHGLILAKFLANKKIVNGILLGIDESTIFNGSHCMAAAIVSHLKKDDLGGIYLHAAGTRDLCEEYLYTVTPKFGEEASIRCEGTYKTEVIFDLPASKAVLAIPELVSKDE